VELVVSVIEELIDRNGLKIALLNRNEEDLILLLKFIQWKIRDPKVMNTLLYIFNLLIDYYMGMYGRNKEIDGLFKQILSDIQQEINQEKQLLEISSTIESMNNLYLYLK
jgi:U3 small nucleolar RNA-associated protein 15